MGAKKDFKTTGNNNAFFTEAEKETKKETRKRRVDLVLPPSLYEEVKRYADNNYLSVNQVFINAVNNLIKNDR